MNIVHRRSGGLVATSAAASRSQPRARVGAIIAELQRELQFGCLFISHDLAVVRQVSAQVVVLRAGRVVESGLADDVLSRPREPYTQRLLASVPVPDPRVRRSRRERVSSARR